MSIYSTDPSQYGVGIVAGDPFYQTYDGAVIKFQGRCHYRLTGTCPDVKLPDGVPTFEIDVANTKSPHDTGRSYTDDIHFVMNYRRLKISNLGKTTVFGLKDCSTIGY